jgi:Fic family protein
MNIFQSIIKKKAILDSLRPLTQGEVLRLREEFILQNTYNSNAIEGSTLTMGETALILEGVTIDQKPLKEHLEAVGHKDAFLFILEQIKEKTTISEKLIKDIHSLVLMDRAIDKGVYRRVPITIGGSEHIPPQPYLIAPQMESLILQNEQLQEKDPIERVAIFHLLFEGIHPFIDGNGRTGRLLMNYDLLLSGYLPISVKFTDRKRYYGCFESYYKDNSHDEMIKLIAEYEEAELDRYIDMLGGGQ